MATEPVSVILPEPPSSNKYWRTHGHTTYRTREAKTYCEAVAALTAQYRVNGQPCFPTGDVSVVVVWHRSAKRGDLDNRSKILYDSLQGSLYDDDAQIAQDWRRRVDTHPTIPKGFVQIEVCPIATDPV